MEPDFKTYDFYLLRTPRLPKSVFLELNRFEKKEEIWDYLKYLLKNQHLLDSIYIASQDLFEQFLQYKDLPYTPTVDRVLISLFKYFSRMSTRSTPYGLFSGVSIGEFSNSSSKIILNGEFLPSLRFDKEFSSFLVELILKERNLKHNVCFYANNTIVQYNLNYRYITFKTSFKKKIFMWASVERNPLLDKIIIICRKGWKFFDLKNILCCSFNIEEGRAEKYLNELIEAKLLISEFEFTGVENSSEIIFNKLVKLSQASPIKSSFEKLKKDLEQLNKKEINLNNFVLPEDIETFKTKNVKNSLQADMKLGTSKNRIDKKIIDIITKELKELTFLNSFRPSSDLISFCNSYYQRYGEREIPLLEAIDPERGVGYGASSFTTIDHTPLLLGLNINKKIKEDLKEICVKTLMERHWYSNSKNYNSIELTEKDLENMKTSDFDEENNFPPGFYVLGNLITQGKTWNFKNFRFNLLAGGGSSSIPLMTRFCHLDKELEEKVRKCSKTEAQQFQNCDLAEIVFIPENRESNILSRPIFLKYEIPIIGKSNYKNKTRISLEDLMVSVKNGKVILRSKRLNKQIIPRLSSAHNFRNGLAVYKFLCDLQYQYGALDFAWDWKELSNLPFTPRVTYKHIILTRARWKIPKQKKKRKKNDWERIISELREKYKIPLKIVLAEGDNELILDLNNPIGAEVFLKKLRKDNVIVYENIFEQFDSPVKNTQGKEFSNELIIPFSFEKKIKKRKLKSKTTSNIQRVFPPGSEWAFIKIYSGMMKGEKLLRNEAVLFINELKKMD